jgi:NAD(P)-dependent dehydrogenase (short-subunit alcohol dehydrogenase family)
MGTVLDAGASVTFALASSPAYSTAISTSLRAVAWPSLEGNHRMMPPEYDIEGRTVIVTAASRGIGKGIVRVLAEAGAKVMVTALTDRYLGPLADEMTAAGHPIETITADATKSEDWTRTIDAALERFGHIDVLINTLGDSIRKTLIPLPEGRSTEPLTDDEWRFVMDINLTQAFMGCRAIGPHFVDRKQGKVINVSSFAARSGTPGMLAYSTAKAGLTRLTQTLALEWAPYGITVNCIAPGSFPDTELADEARLTASVARAKTEVPLGRYGALREAGLLALYLASDAASYMTGETLHLDGGMTHP